MRQIQEIKFSDPAFPEKLKKIKKPPKSIFVSGVLDLSGPAIAIVGTRNFSIYGKQAALDFSSKLASTGLTIISGLAPGIDTFSHLAALDQKAKTIAVLGTGLDEKSIYPKTNLRLAENIEKRGCLISEYPPGTAGTQYTFPLRNRIISALADAVLVIEAREKSGSLITAEYAFSQDKKIFAVPGQIYSQNSKGCNWLIKRGAALADTPETVLDTLGIENKKSAVFSAENREEEIILKLLGENQLSTDKIIELTSISPSLVAATLVNLEITGKIRNLGTDIFSLKK